MFEKDLKFEYLLRQHIKIFELNFADLSSPESYIFKILKIGLISSQNIHILPTVLNMNA